jgi:UV excision repair protein RAD23
MNGIPPNFPPAGTPTPAAAAPPAGGASPGVVPGAAVPPAGGAAPATGGTPPALAALRQHPQFNQMRQLVQENPAALEPLLQQIGAQSPGNTILNPHVCTPLKNRGV